MKTLTTQMPTICSAQRLEEAILGVYICYLASTVPSVYLGGGSGSGQQNTLLFHTLLHY